MCRVSAHTQRSILTLSRQLLSRGYHVVFLHRKGSLLPFVRTLSPDGIFDLLDGADDAKKASLMHLVTKRSAARKEGRLLELPFVSVVVRHACACDRRLTPALRSICLRCARRCRRCRRWAGG